MSKKFLIRAKYTSSGVNALLQKGGTVRKEAVSKMITDAGGKLESFYYTLNTDEAYVTCELPDEITAAALALNIDATGKVDIEMILLLTPEQLDEAAHKTVHYKAPGQ
jgi:uncharacterized protein with GYD domain